MRTTRLGYEIIKSAEEVLAMGYRAYNRNLYGEVLEEVIKEFDTLSNKKYYRGKGKEQVDYCGITQSVILDRAFRNYDGSLNSFRTASAGEFKNLAKKHGIRIDKKATVGALFLYPRSGGSGYHIGLVYKIIDGGFESIEGNTYSSNSYIIDKDGCAIKLGANEYGILTRPRTINKDIEFIHIEELYGNEIFTYPDSNQYLADTDDKDFCVITDDIVPEIEGDFVGAEATPKSLLTREEKFIIGCSGALFGLGIITRISK